MFVVDASVWVASYRTQDQHHFESQQWIREVITSGDTILGPAILLAEVAGALARLSGDTSGALAPVENMRRFPKFELAVASKELADLSAQIAAELRLRGADAVYVAVAVQRGVPLITFDDQQRNRASQRVRTATPAASGPF